MAFTRTGSATTAAATAPVQRTTSLAAAKPQALATMGSYEIEAGGQKLTVTTDDIINFICPKATPAECKIFLETCKAYHLNPFTKDAYLIHYDNKNDDAAAAIVLGKTCYMQRAEARPEFDGFEAGLIVYIPDAGTIEHRAGSLLFDGEQLIGGWAKVYRKDRTLPCYEEVNLKEYNTGKSQWAARPATMIRKVALVHALREAFPSCYSGLYDESEIQVDAESTARVVDDDPLSEAAREKFARHHAARQLKRAQEAAPDADNDIIDAGADSAADPFGGDEP